MNYRSESVSAVENFNYELFTILLNIQLRCTFDVECLPLAYAYYLIMSLGQTEHYIIRYSGINIPIEVS